MRLRRDLLDVAFLRARLLIDAREPLSQKVGHRTAAGRWCCGSSGL
jgi:hypothetical protein